MEKITAFKSIDGSIHERERDAYDRDRKLTIVRTIHSEALYKNDPEKQKVWDHAISCFSVYFYDLVREVGKLGPAPSPNQAEGVDDTSWAT